MNDLHFSKLKEALEKKDINIWNDFVLTMDIRIDLSDADLICTDLFWVNLRGADLSDADLKGANLYCANLNGVNLRGADLSGTNLSGANLIGADLNGVNLSDANLYCTYLSGANLSFADLRGADLRSADLRSVNFRGTNLNGVDLSGTDLRSANTYGISISTFKGSKHFAFQIGEFISIGCYTLKISEWIKRANKIATKENYTNEEKNEYLKYINECKEKI